MTDTLRTRLLAAVQQRMDVARAATPGPWDYQAQSLHMDGSGTYRIWPPGKPQVLTSFMRGADPIHITLNDPATVLRHCERDLKVLERHAPVVENVEWWDCHDGSGKAPVCGSCGNREPQEWDLGMGNYHTKPAGWVSSYVLWPCPEITDLAAAYGVDVDGG